MSCGQPKIPLPPLAEQKNIVKKLDALAEKAHRLYLAQAVRELIDEGLDEDEAGASHGYCQPPL